MHFDGPTAPHSRRRQVFCRLAAAHLFLKVKLANRLVHLRFQRHSEPQQRNGEPEPPNDLRFRVRADAEHVRARLHRHRRERLQPMTVGIGLHHHAQLRGSREPAQILDVAEEALARDQHLHVMLSHRYMS